VQRNDSYYGIGGVGGGGSTSNVYSDSSSSSTTLAPLPTVVENGENATMMQLTGSDDEFGVNATSEPMEGSEEYQQQFFLLKVINIIFCDQTLHLTSAPTRLCTGLTPSLLSNTPHHSQTQTRKVKEKKFPSNYFPQWYITLEELV
jgi:hypothetical protein